VQPRMGKGEIKGGEVLGTLSGGRGAMRVWIDGGGVATAQREVR
jgi:hypothetical protein